MDKVQGLDFGADDYLAKPFDANELMARVRALLRRVGLSLIDTKLTVGNLIVDPGPIRVTVSEVELGLRRKEFQVLELLARRAETVISANYILERVWGYSDDEAQTNLRTYIKTLRKALDRAGSSATIQTVHGVGYKLTCKPT
jgi:two-component system response regulator MprA